MNLHVISSGFLTTVQDLGRREHAAIGVGCAGAMDTVALRLANALVGNDEADAGFEVTLRGPSLSFDTDALVSLTGGDIDATCDGRPVPMWRPVTLAAGSRLDIGAMQSGTRAYVALAGGIAVDATLGSRSTDVNAALGPPPLNVGDRLAVTPRRFRERSVSLDAPAWSLDPSIWFDSHADRAIAVTRGTHFDQLDGDSQRRFFSSEFRIASQSNRVGYRFDGAPLTLLAPVELVSEGSVPGTIQLPPDGQPIALMSEAPTTGGYPRIAHVASVDLPHLAQRRPGHGVRFAEISIAEAQTRYLRRERELRALRTAILERLQRWLS